MGTTTAESICLHFDYIFSILLHFFFFKLLSYSRSYWLNHDSKDNVLYYIVEGFFSAFYFSKFTGGRK